MGDVLSFNEYPTEKVFEAQDLYCVDRLTYEAVSLRTGVSVATLKRWSDKYGWRAKREELALLESQIRADTYRARAKMLAQVIKGGGALDAFAVAKLETMVIDQARFRAEQEKETAPVPVKIESPAQAAELLEAALEKKLGALLAAPGTIDLKAIKDLRQALDLLADMRRQSASGNSPAQGLSPDADARIRNVLEGGL